MAAKHSAGILLYRVRDGAVEVFLVHPGGPFWAKKDAGAWSLPKGEFEPGDDPKAAALREFAEETGQDVLRERGPELVALPARKQPGGKTIHAWALSGDCNASDLRSNTFTMEWPPRSGRQAEFPEVDRGAWFPLQQARGKIIKGQAGFLDDLSALLAGR